MRAISFSSSFPSSWDPTAGVFVLRRLAALARKVDLEVVHPVPVCPLIGRFLGPAALPSREVIDALTVHHRPFPYVPGAFKQWDARFYAMGLARWLCRHCAADRPDLLDGHFVWPDGVGVAYLARRLGLAYTITLRGTILPRYRDGRFRDRIAEALRGAAAVISLSDPMAQIAAELGAKADRVHVIPNGVDTDQFSPINRGEARGRLGLAADGRLLVSVASLRPVKGHEDLIEAVATLGGDVRLVIVGRQMDRGAYPRRLRALIRHHGLGRRVRLAGVVSPREVAAYFSAADVSVLASHSEGCPNVVLESLACGTPVVATSVGAVPEIVRPGVNGQVVPPGSPAALAEALGTALEATWSRDDIRRSVAERSWSSVAGRVLSVFEAVAGRR